jgi:Protein of unknown function (DUF2637)
MLRALVAAGLFCYGAAGSYASVAALAAARQMPLPHLIPVGVNGGLIGTALLDIVLTWIGMPLPWLRQLTRALMVATVAANGAWRADIGSGAQGGDQSVGDDPGELRGDRTAGKQAPVEQWSE